MNPTSAFRSTSTSHFDDEMAGLQENELKSIRVEQAKERQALNEISSLREHPGWIRIRESLMGQVQDIRSGRTLEQALLNPELSDTQIGQMVRTTNLLAQRLEDVIGLVDNTGLEDAEE